MPGALYIYDGRLITLCVLAVTQFTINSDQPLILVKAHQFILISTQNFSTNLNAEDEVFRG